MLRWLAWLIILPLLAASLAGDVAGTLAFDNAFMARRSSPVRVLVAVPIMAALLAVPVALVWGLRRLLAG